MAQRGRNVRMDLCHVLRKLADCFLRKSPETTLFTKALKTVLMRMATISLQKLELSRPEFTVGNDVTRLAYLALR